MFKKNETLAPTMQEINRRRSSTNMLEELITCKLCSSKLSHPKMLPCQHTFCFNCLRVHFDRKLQSNSHNIDINNKICINCPTCNLPLLVRQNFSVEQLPRNFYLDSFLHLFDSQESLLQEKQCVNCQDECHINEYCNHCQKTFCKPCWKEHITTIQENFSLLMDHLVESENNLEKRFTKFKKSYEEIASSIKFEAEKKIAQLKLQETQNLEKLENLLCENEEMCSKFTRRILQIKKTIQNKNSIDDDKQRVELYMRFHVTISNILNEISQFKITQPTFDGKKLKFHKMEEGKSEKDQVDGVQGFPKNKEAMSGFYRSKIFCPKLIWTKCPKPSGLGVPPWSDDIIYLAADAKKMVMAINRNNFKIISRLSIPDMVFPYGIAFCEKRKEIYVSDKWKSCIHVFSSEEKYKRSFNVVRNTSDILRNPCGIAISHKEHLVVCDVGNDRVICLNPENGALLKTLGVNKNVTEFVIPSVVATYRDTIIVGDSGTHRIKVYNTSGKKLTEFGSMGRHVGQFKSIDAVTCDLMGFILVGDSINERIQVFQPDGTLVRVFTSFKGSTGKLKHISGIVVTPQFEIVVSDYINGRLYVF